MKNEVLGEAPFTVGDRISFSCDEKYELSGVDVVTCDSGLKWTSSTPTCVSESATQSAAGNLKYSAVVVLLICTVLNEL